MHIACLCYYQQLQNFSDAIAYNKFTWCLLKAVAPLYNHTEAEKGNFPHLQSAETSFPQSVYTKTRVDNVTVESCYLPQAITFHASAEVL